MVLECFSEWPLLVQIRGSKATKMSYGDFTPFRDRRDIKLRNSVTFDLQIGASSWTGCSEAAGVGAVLIHKTVLTRRDHDRIP